MEAADPKKRDIHLGVRLPFDTRDDQESSERFLMALLGFNCMVNHRHLLQHPETPLLYDSGVVYTPPAQVSPNRLPVEAMAEVAKLLRTRGAEQHTIATILRILNGVEEFVDVGELYKRGKGDCNELAPVRVAELWRAGVPASPFLQKAPNDRGGITYHSIVVWPDGSGEDPSLILGMGGSAREDERREEIRKNKERWDAQMAAAEHLVLHEGADPLVVGAQVDMLGLLPKRGLFPR